MTGQGLIEHIVNAAIAPRRRRFRTLHSRLRNFRKGQKRTRTYLKSKRLAGKRGCEKKGKTLAATGCGVRFPLDAGRSAICWRSRWIILSEMRDLGLECSKEYTYTVRYITPAWHDAPDRKLLHRCVLEVDPDERLFCQVPKNVPVRQHDDSQPPYGCSARRFDTRGGHTCFHACAY